MEYQTIGETDKNNDSFVKNYSKESVVLNDYIERAKQHLVKVVENYKNLYGKSMVDQKQLIPEPY